MGSQAEVAQTRDRHRCPEREQAPGQDGEEGYLRGHTEAHQGRDRDTFDHTKAARRERYDACQVGGAVRQQHGHGVDPLAVGREEEPQAGSVAHFSSEIFVDNFCQYVDGRAMTRHFDGHANCFVETGDGKGLLIDFNYDTEPLPGRFPLGRLGPLSLLKETKANHWGKLAFRWVYWHLLLPGRPLPVPARMSMSGKHRPDEEVRS